MISAEYSILHRLKSDAVSVMLVVNIGYRSTSEELEPSKPTSGSQRQRPYYQKSEVT